EGDLVIRVAPVVRAQPVDEVVHLLVAPHPRREARERRELERRATGTAEHVVVDPGSVGPVALHRDEVEASTGDELARDARAHAVELARAMRRLAQQDEARVADSIDERVERRGLDVVDPIGRFADEAGEPGGTAGHVRGPRQLPAPAPGLLADEGDEANVHQRLLAELRVVHARHAREDLRRLVGADRDHQASADRQLRDESRRNDGTARGHRDGVVGAVLGPPERTVARGHLHVGEPELREPGLRALGQRRNALDRPYGLCETPQDGGGIAGARPHLENALSAFQGERLRGEGDDVWLRDRLPFGDRQRRVVVGELRELLGEERFPRDVPERVHDARIGDPAAGELPVDHASAASCEVRRGCSRHGRHSRLGAASLFACGSGISVIVASVSKRTPATETAFSSAIRTTLVGSMIPASTRSTYVPRAASKPEFPFPVRIFSTTTPASTPELVAIWRTGASSAPRRIRMPLRSSPSHRASSCWSASAARRRVSPAPGTMPSATAAFVALMASSRASFRDLSSVSDGAPTRTTATPPASFARRSWSFSRS